MLIRFQSAECERRLEGTADFTAEPTVSQFETFLHVLGGLGRTLRPLRSLFDLGFREDGVLTDDALGSAALAPCVRVHYTLFVIYRKEIFCPA